MYDHSTANKATDLDSILEAFERDDEVSGGADIVAYLPPADAPSFQRIAVELIRVDLERSWARGRRKRLESYRAITPQLFSDPIRLAEIAFEEYRLRKQAGEAVNAAEYKRRYSIDTSVWPADEVREQGDTLGAPSDYYSESLVRSRRELDFPHVGETFAGFELVEQLGRGAFGVVFRAHQADLAARDVVLKITAARSVEPQRLARLQHTNIVPLYSMHEADSMLAICMPFFGRRTLCDIIRYRKVAQDLSPLSTIADRNDQTLPIGDLKCPASEPAKATDYPISKAIDVPAAVELIAQLAEGLGHAHQREIIHSDLKPANVLLTDDDVPMLLDFNLASDSASSQKATLFVGGTLPYMAPEHLLAIRDNGTVIAPSDIYSLGVIAYELFSGRRPFEDHAGEFDHKVDLLITDRRSLPPLLNALNPRVSPGLTSIVQHCLEFETSRRYHTASQLAEDLRRYQQNLPLRYACEGSLTERTTKWWRRNSRALAQVAAAALVVALVSLSAAYIIRQQRVAKLEQVAAFNAFQADAQAALLYLRAPGSEDELHAIGRQTAEGAVEHLHLLHDGTLNISALSNLTPDQQSDARRRGTDLFYALASLSVPRGNSGATLNPNALEAALQYNAAAITLASKRAADETLLRQRLALFKSIGDRDGAAHVSEELAHIAGEGTDNYLATADLLEQHRFAEAVAAGEQLCNEDRQDPQRWLMLGNAYVGNGRLPSAEACYTALIALQPKAVSGYLYRGLCRADEGNPPGAERDFSDALLLNPSLAVTRINRALAYYAEKKFDAAERDATVAMEAGLADPRAYFVRALIRDALGKHDQAKEDRERGLTIPPVDDKGWVARGIALLREHPDRAAHEFASGLERYPSSKPLLQNLIHVYADILNKPGDALAYSGKFLELCPRDSAAYASRAVLLARQGDIEAALKDGAQAASAQPTALTSLQLACVYSLTSAKKPETMEQAILHLRKSLSVDPKLAQRASADPDLVAAQATPEFKALIAAAQLLSNATVSGGDAINKPHEQNSQNSNDTAAPKTPS